MSGAGGISWKTPWPGRGTIGRNTKRTIDWISSSPAGSSGSSFFSRSAAERRRIGKPHACGKIVLAVAKKRDGGLDFEGFRIDYTGRFVFDPLPVVEEKETAP